MTELTIFVGHLKKIRCMTEKLTQVLINCDITDE